MNNLLRLARDYITELYQESAPIILCLIGGVTFGVLFHDEDASAFIRVTMFAVAVIMWAFAIDLARQKARAKGFADGIAMTIKSMVDADKIKINVIDSNKDKRETGNE